MKKIFCWLVLANIITPAIFSQTEKPSIHQPFDVLIGLNIGFGGMETGNITHKKAGTLVISADLGVTGDFYIFNWLSVTTGLLLHPEGHLILDSDISEINGESFSLTDYAATPICLTIPISTHINIPHVEWLYAGLGLHINMPVASLLGSANLDVDTKGGVFLSLPIDLGFDLIKADKGGARFFFRVTPTFLEKGVVVPVGFIWQIHNWKVYSKNS
jgi:hypothetical protein